MGMRGMLLRRNNRKIYEKGTIYYFGVYYPSIYYGFYMETSIPGL